MSRKRRFYASLSRCPRRAVERLEEIATAEEVADALAERGRRTCRPERVFWVMLPTGGWRRL